MHLTPAGGSAGDGFAIGRASGSAGLMDWLSKGVDFCI
jgi:hypothetical protein